MVEVLVATPPNLPAAGQRRSSVFDKIASTFGLYTRRNEKVA